MGKRRKLDKPQIEAGQTPSWVSWAILGVIVLVYAAIRIRMLGIPIERDEGEYAYVGQLILKGVPPFKLAYNMKLPGIYYAYALVMGVFGQSVVGIHLGLLVVNAASMVLLYLIARRLFDSTVGLVSAAAFGFLTINQNIFGTQAHATHFVVLPALAGILFALKAVESKKLLHVALSGVLVGIALTMKQQGMFFVPFVLIYLLANDLRERPIRAISITGRACVFIACSALPYILICALMAASGVFGRFWLWTFEYARNYVGEIPVGQALGVFLKNTSEMAGPSVVLWLLAGLGLVLVWVDGATRKRALWMTGFFLFSLATIVPGFYFRQHYYVTWMPSLALLIGVFVGSARNILKRLTGIAAVSYIPAAVFVVGLLFTINAHSEFLLRLPMDQATRSIYGGNPWIETQEIAKYLKAHSKPTDTIAVLGSEPQLPFFADRRSATGYIYTYPLMERQKLAGKMQKEMIAEIEKSKPKYIVFVSISTSWLWRQGSDMTILNWALGEYIPKNYTQMGYVMTYYGGLGPSSFTTEYIWGDKARAYPIKPDNGIYIFERKIEAN